MKHSFLAAILGGLTVACSALLAENPQSASSLEGLWRGTAETAREFPSGTSTAVLRLQRGADGALIASGVFLLNGAYYMDWPLHDFACDVTSGRLSFTDGDGDTYVGRWDPALATIVGGVQLEGGGRDPLDFERAEPALETALYHPRLPGDDGRFDLSYHMPESIDDGLATASILDEGIREEDVSAILQRAIDGTYGRMESLLAIKGGRLVLEEYFHGWSRERLHRINSCTKSVASLLVGMALERHPEASLQQSVFDYFPECADLRSGGRERITLENLLTMTSGLEWDEFPREMWKSPDWTRCILDRPMACAPGERFHYNSGCSILLGEVVARLEGRSVDDFAAERLFAPLGIVDHVWDAHSDGTFQCGNGLSLRPRDMAKIGLLVLGDGVWQGRQLVPKAWIARSTSPLVEESPFFDYGYQWWHRSSANLQWWTDPQEALPSEHDMIVALGWGGQYILIVSDLDLVVATTGTVSEDDENGLARVRLVVEELAPLFEAAAPR